MLEHSVWNINLGEDAGKNSVLVAVQAFDRIGSDVSSLCECALIASSEDLRKLNTLAWTVPQLVEAANRTRFEWGYDRANEVGLKLAAAVRPLAEQATSGVAEKWYMSVRVLVDLFAKGQNVPASQISSVLDSIPEIVGFKWDIASLHTFIEEFLQAMQR